jgi:lambda family phage portal protein
MRLSETMPASWGEFLAPAASLSPPERPETAYRGASHVLRSMQAYTPLLGSAASDLPAWEQMTLRARSRDAMRNHPLARAAMTRSRTNIVGTGLMCRPAVDADVLGLSADAAKALNRSLRQRFRAWAESPQSCDWEATSDFYGLQGLALLSAMASGDVFALTPLQDRPGNTSELKVQLVEADRVSNPRDGADTENLIDGIAMDGGVPVGCWVRSQHPGEVRTMTRIASWEFYPFFGAETGRRRVLHVWNDKERPGQVRGAPYLAPILEPLVQISRYGGAELMAAVLSAMMTFFIERDREQLDENGNPIPFADDGAFRVGEGAVVDLAPGEKANMANPSRPNAQFDPFFMAVTKQIGAALELPVDELLLHYQSSYSAARAAMLQAWRFYTMRRWVLAQQFCQPIYALWLDLEVASGRLTLPGYADPMRRIAYSRALWIGPSRGSMDEEKEARAAKTRIEIGVSNEAIETAQMTGEDWEDVYEQRLEEVNRRKADGTWAAQGQAQPVARVERPDPEDEDDDDSSV